MSIRIVLYFEVVPVGRTMSLFGNLNRTQEMYFFFLESLYASVFMDGDKISFLFSIEVNNISLLSSVISAVTLWIHRRLTSV